PPHRRQRLLLQGNRRLQLLPPRRFFVPRLRRPRLRGLPQRLRRPTHRRQRRPAQTFRNLRPLPNLLIPNHIILGRLRNQTLQVPLRVPQLLHPHLFLQSPLHQRLRRRFILQILLRPLRRRPVLLQR